MPGVPLKFTREFAVTKLEIEIGSNLLSCTVYSQVCKKYCRFWRLQLQVFAVLVIACRHKIVYVPCCIFVQFTVISAFQIDVIRSCRFILPDIPQFVYIILTQCRLRTYFLSFVEIISYVPHPPNLGSE